MDRKVCPGAQDLAEFRVLVTSITDQVPEAGKEVAIIMGALDLVIKTGMMDSGITMVHGLPAKGRDVREEMMANTVRVEEMMGSGGLGSTQAAKDSTGPAETMDDGKDASFQNGRSAVLSSYSIF